MRDSALLLAARKAGIEPPFAFPAQVTFPDTGPGGRTGPPRKSYVPWGVSVVLDASAGINMNAKNAQAVLSNP
jgi:hypothetical protein